MKRLLAILFATLSLSANADSWAIRNKSGGEIIITDRECPGYPELKRAYTYQDNGKIDEGCWTIFDNRVQVAWKNGSRYTYSIESFYVKEKTKKGTSL